MEGKKRLFIEPPADEYGNRGYGCVVIEGEIVGDSINVTAPEGFRWPSVCLRFFQEVSVEAGPARFLQGDHVKKIQELNKLLEKYAVK